MKRYNNLGAGHEGLYNAIIVQAVEDWRFLNKKIIADENKTVFFDSKKRNVNQVKYEIMLINNILKKHESKIYEMLIDEFKKEYKKEPHQGIISKKRLTKSCKDDIIKKRAGDTVRLWHYELIDNGILPKSQLLGQWRELNSIYVKKNRHILINYVYDYNRKYLYNYSLKVIKQLERLNYTIKKWDNFDSYFKNTNKENFEDLNYKEHNNRYLLQCAYNLQEKYDRGQSDYTAWFYGDLVRFMKKKGFENFDKE